MRRILILFCPLVGVAQGGRVLSSPWDPGLCLRAAAVLLLQGWRSGTTPCSTPSGMQRLDARCCPILPVHLHKGMRTPSGQNKTGTSRASVASRIQHLVHGAVSPWPGLATPAGWLFTVHASVSESGSRLGSSGLALCSSLTPAFLLGIAMSLPCDPGASGPQHAPRLCSLMASTAVWMQHSCSHGCPPRSAAGCHARGLPWCCCSVQVWCWGRSFPGLAPVPVLV